MTQAGALQKKRARYLTDFLEVWYDWRAINMHHSGTMGSKVIAQESPAIYGAEKETLEDQMYIQYVANNKIAGSNLLKKYNSDLIESPLMNIYDLWLGNFEQYQLKREKSSNDLISSKQADIYIQESLVQYQYAWIIQLFDKNIELKQKFEPIYFVALMLKNSNLDLNLIVPEPMLESVLDVIKYVRLMQEFYYGK